MESPREERLLLPLTSGEALVLFNWLASVEDELLDTLPLPERQVVLRILGRLGKNLLEPYLPNYVELLAAARGRLECLTGDPLGQEVIKRG